MAETSSADATVSGLLTFRANGQLYALPAAGISEIIKVPPVARLPQGPKALLGMANLRGSVIAVASLRALLGFDTEIFAPSARAIVLAGASTIAITVEAVERLVSADEADEAVATVLDLPALLARAFLPRAAKPFSIAKISKGQMAQTGGPRIETRELITFEVAAQTYALDLSEVQEIIAIPEAIAAVPQAEALIMGLAAYRDQLLPLFSLRGLLGFPAARDPGNKVIVTLVTGRLVGLVADRMRAIVHADIALIEPAPALLAARAGGESRINSIYRGPDGLISLLATAKLFGDEVMAQLTDQPRIQSETAPGLQRQQLQFLVFRLGSEEFALPISAVTEVARVPEKITRLPKTPKFLSGVVNLRGEVLPVIDQRSRFDLPGFTDDHALQRLIVMRSARHQAGLIVDGISEVLSAASDAIEAAPHLAGEESRLVRGVLNLETAGRLILILDPDELLTQAERKLLDAFNAATRQKTMPPNGQSAA